MLNVKNITRFTAVCLALSASSLVAAKNQLELKGCYDVVGGHYEISRGNDPLDVLGKYRLVLEKSELDMNHRGKRHVVLNGPLKGTPHTKVDGGFITDHVMATNDRVGTMTSRDDDFIIKSVGCISDDGQPRYIEATEHFVIKQGTGVFTKVVPGSDILWDGAFDACSDPLNHTADFEALSGTICFSE